jgi:hypothetical protein
LSGNVDPRLYRTRRNSIKQRSIDGSFVVELSNILAFGDGVDRFGSSESAEEELEDSGIILEVGLPSLGLNGVTARRTRDVKVSATLIVESVPIIPLEYLEMKSRPFLFSSTVFRQELDVEWEAEEEAIGHSAVLVFHQSWRDSLGH